MDIKFEELEKLYSQYFSLKYLGSDISNKLALISLINWTYNKLKAKNPSITYWQVVWKLGKETNVSEDFLKGLAVVCQDFGIGCTQFPTFNIAEKEIPKKIKELLNEYVPF